MRRLLFTSLLWLCSHGVALVPDINARIMGVGVVAKDPTGKVVWTVPVPRLGGRVGSSVSWTNSWIPDAVIIQGRDDLGYRWFTLLERADGRVRWQGRGSPLIYAAGQLLVEPDVPSGLPDRWKFQRFDVRTGRADLVVFRHERPRRGCGKVVYSAFGPTNYSFPYTANPRLIDIRTADECSPLSLIYDWTASPFQEPRVRPLPCLDDAFQSMPCSKSPT